MTDIRVTYGARFLYVLYKMFKEATYCIKYLKNVQLKKIQVTGKVGILLNLSSWVKINKISFFSGWNCGVTESSKMIPYEALDRVTSTHIGK